MAISQTGGAESGAFSAKSDPIDPDLQRVIDCWDNLPQPLKAAVLAMIGTTRKDD